VRRKFRINHDLTIVELQLLSKTPNIGTKDTLMCLA